MKKIDVIGVPMKYGCFVEGADLSYEYLKPSFEKVFEVKCRKQIDISYDNPVMHASDKKLKFVEPVMEINKRLYKEVYDSLSKNKLPIMVGGDHSIAIGSISASLDYYKGDVSVIYIDQHADIHNDKTSPSGNLHGIPLSVCIGKCDDRFNIGEYKLDTSNLYFIGLGNYEIEEISYIQENNISCYMDFEVEERRVESIVKEILKKIKTKNVHISFDFDSIKHEDFPAVNVSVEGKYYNEEGLPLRMVKRILKLLISNLNVCSIDIVEYNPLLDEDGKCIEKAEEILLEIKESMEVQDDNSK